MKNWPKPNPAVVQALLDRKRKRRPAVEVIGPSPTYVAPADGVVRKVLLATLNYDHPQNGQIRAFQEVFGRDNVFNFDYIKRQEARGNANQEFLQTVLQVRPDWVWMQVQQTNILRADVIASVTKLPLVVTHWMGDLRTASDRGEYMPAVCRATDMTLLSNAGQLEEYKALGAPEVGYLQIGLDWDEDVMGLPAWEPPFRVPDVVFCGNYYEDQFPEGSRERMAAVIALQNAGIDVGVVGASWPDGMAIGKCGVKQQHHVWKRAKIALNVNNYNHIEGYYSDRQLIAMASGTPVVCRYIPGLEKEFTNGEHCFWFETESELVKIVQRLLADPELRARVGAAGRAEVIKNHTWKARVESLVPLMQQRLTAKRYAQQGQVGSPRMSGKRDAATKRGVGIVFGTYNRMELLKKAVASARVAAGGMPYRMYAVDGGSIDGSREWLASQTDIALIQQELPLTGAVRAFNLGFGQAVDDGWEYVAHFNDDAEYVNAGGPVLAMGAEILGANRRVGEVAFEFDLRGTWGFEDVYDRVYANFGIIRREAGMEVARRQGDPSGKAWWNPIYRTYGADTEFGCWLMQLGWTVYPGVGIRVHDCQCMDDMRIGNGGSMPNRKEGKLFWARWESPGMLCPGSVPFNQKLPETLDP